MKMLYFKDLRSKGIKWSRQHIDRKVKKKQFPPPAWLGENTKAWPEHEIDEWLAACIAARDAPTPATQGDGAEHAEGSEGDNGQSTAVAKAPPLRRGRARRLRAVTSEPPAA